MGCAYHSGHVLQCPELCAGQWYNDELVGVGVHQGFVLSPLLIIPVLEVLSREFRSGVPWEVLYADDLVLIADNKEECIPMLKAWRAGMKSRGLRVIMKKPKFLVSGDGHEVLQKYVKYLSAVCCSGVGRNSTLCSQCMVWVHKMCGGITKWLFKEPKHFCPRCMGEFRLIDGRTVRKWIWMAPCLIWKPLPATQVICLAPVGAVTVSLLPDAAWPKGSSRNLCLSWPPDTPHQEQVARCAKPVFTRLCSKVAKMGYQRNANCEWPCHDPLDLWHQSHGRNTLSFTTTGAWHWE